MTKFKVQTLWYDQWDKRQPRPPSTSCLSRRTTITLAVWRSPRVTPAHPHVPGLANRFSKN